MAHAVAVDPLGEFVRGTPEDVERAVEIHNDIPYGLAYANFPCIGAAVRLPFGGVKKSGKSDQ